MGWLVSGPAMGTAQTNMTLILHVPGSTPACSCLHCPQLPELLHFLLWELSLPFYIFQRHRVCLVDHVVLNFSLHSYSEGFQSSSLATLPLGFNCGFISTSVCGSSTGVCSWGCPGGFRSASVKTGCGDVAAAWIMGTLAMPCTQGSQRPLVQEIWCY